MVRSQFSKIILFSLFYLVQVKVHAEWQIDLSRRQVAFDRIENTRMPATEVVVTETPEQKKNRLNSELSAAIRNTTYKPVSGNDVVIALTDDGFVPAVVQLQKGQTYQIHVINISQKEKNTSFLLDAFSQSHNTTFGQMRSFSVSPKADGTFAYQSPEASAFGAIIVGNEQERKVASTTASTPVENKEK